MVAIADMAEDTQTLQRCPEQYCASMPYIAAKYVKNLFCLPAILISTGNPACCQSKGAVV